MFEFMRCEPVSPPVQDPGVIKRLAGDGDGGPGAGDDHAVGRKRSSGRERYLPAIAGSYLQARHRIADNLGLSRFGDFAQVHAPLAVRRTHPAAVDPIAVDALRNQVTLPAVSS